ncbi:hypothetical protein E5163_04300 [Marinicauda algicola]|uniref:HEAT repeat domain-containing protein n=1 Tax=Marinicauda algicola TaxID=2029849 RepID=A0A4S2H4W8_9PROT|nr:hypothetical protein [Marinicauda algicola]TGY90352.1 hypothetical protein E5163_04300 [Marinicauda algicola]
MLLTMLLAGAALAQAGPPDCGSVESCLALALADETVDAGDIRPVLLALGASARDTLVAVAMEGGEAESTLALRLLDTDKEVEAPAPGEAWHWTTGDLETLIALLDRTAELREGAFTVEIARLGTEEAADFLLNEAREDRSRTFYQTPGIGTSHLDGESLPDSDFLEAVQVLGTRAYPHALDRLSENPDSIIAPYLQLRGLENGAIADLLDRAGDRSRPVNERRAALVMLAAVDGLGEESALRLWSLEPSIPEAARVDYYTALAFAGQLAAVPKRIEACAAAPEQAPRNCFALAQPAFEAGYDTAEPTRALVAAVEYDSVFFDYLVEIADEFAVPALLDMLHSNDWRERYHALRGLERLRLTSALEAVDQIAEGHWLPAIRRQAELSAYFIRKGTFDGADLDRLAPGYDRCVQRKWRHCPVEALAGGPFSGGFDSWNARDGVDPELPVCPSTRWQWQGVAFDAQRSLAPGESRSFQFLEDDYLVLTGTDYGEWYGSLVAQSLGRPPAVLAEAINVVEIEKAEDGFLIASGLAHLGGNHGAISFVSAAETRGYDHGELFALPAAPSGMTEIADGLYAAFARGWALVFDLDGPLGFAGCATAP